MCHSITLSKNLYSVIRTPLYNGILAETYNITSSLLHLWLQMKKIAAISDWAPKKLQLFLIKHKKIAAISDWLLSTQKRRIYIHYCGLFSRKSYIDKNNIQFYGVSIKKVYNFFRLLHSNATHTLTHTHTLRASPLCLSKIYSWLARRHQQNLFFMYRKHHHH